MTSKQIRETSFAEQPSTSTAAISSAFDSALHRGSTHFRGGLRAIVNKDKTHYDLAMSEYFKHWDGQDIENETDDIRQSRRKDYSSLTRQYYNLTTDIYEYSWGQSFHFCRFARGESFSRAILRHQHFLAARIGIKNDMKVLDVGCGVGGPAQEMVKFTGCHVTGLNLSEYQVNHADNYSKGAGLSHKLKFVHGDFMAMPFPDSSFDAVYAIEATLHAPSLQGVYTEIRRVLRPGGVVGIYEWLMTDEYDNENLAHRSIRVDIEQAFGIASMVQVSDALKAVEAAGLELEVHTDLAVDKDGLDTAPWYWPMSRDIKYIQTGWDLISALKHRVSVALALGLLWLLAAVHIAPPGAIKTLNTMAKGGDALVAGGSQHIFTPMYLLIARKPEKLQSGLGIYYICYTAFLTTLGLANFLFVFFQASPFPASWDFGLLSEWRLPHLPHIILIFIQLILFVIADFIYGVFPVLFIWKLNMPTRQKLGIMVIMAGTLVTMGAANSRAVIVSDTLNKSIEVSVKDGMNPAKVFVTFGVASLLASIEVSLLIILGSLPKLRVITKLTLFENLSSSLTSMIVKLWPGTQSSISKPRSHQDYVGSDVELNESSRRNFSDHSGGHHSSSIRAEPDSRGQQHQCRIQVTEGYTVIYDQKSKQPKSYV